MKVLALALTCSIAAFARCDSTDFKTLKLRRTAVWTANTAIPVGVHAALYETWYSNYAHTPFRFHNDNAGWNQMDKVGHGFSAYFITVNSAASFRFAGYPKTKSAVFGSAVSLAFQFAIEYFDGHSAGWGASPGDLVANTAGALFGGLQAAAWGEVRIPVSITFQKSYWSTYRPDVLGDGFLQTKLKDYNAQTYWVSLVPHQMGIKTRFCPKWLGLSLGYGVNGLLGADDNVWEKNGQTFDMSHVVRKRQFYISPALHLSHIPTKHKWVKLLFKLTDHWKLPLPALEFNKPGKPNFHWLYW